MNIKTDCLMNMECVDIMWEFLGCLQNISVWLLGYGLLASIMTSFYLMIPIVLPAVFIIEIQHNSAIEENRFRKKRLQKEVLKKESAKSDMCFLLNSTRIYSRILFAIWIFFVFISCVGPDEFKLSETMFISIFTGVFLLPSVIAVEYSVNPAWIDMRNTKNNVNSDMEEKCDLDNNEVHSIEKITEDILDASVIGMEMKNEDTLTICEEKQLEEIGDLKSEKTSWRMENKELLLTKSQAEKLESGIELPRIKYVDFELRKDEIAVFRCVAKRILPVNTNYVIGKYTITTERIVFECAEHSFSLEHEEIFSITPFKTTGGMIFNDDKSYALLMKHADLADKALRAVCSGDIPIEGEIIKPIKKQTVKAIGTEKIDRDLLAIDIMEGHDFEFFCADILCKNGFEDIKVTKGSGDQGVDIIAVKMGVRYAIQCKRYMSPLGNKSIQEVCAGKLFYNCDIGVVMTNSTFTPKAQELAKATDIMLWDRKKLKQLMICADKIIWR